VSLPFTCRLSVRWRDLDAYQHVNNASFLGYLEEARVLWLESLPEPWRGHAAEPVVARIEVDYLRPIGYPAELELRLEAERVGRSSLTLRHSIDPVTPGGRYADGRTVLVWVDPASGRPTPLPEGVRRAAGVY
jgi:acyl-CoA thioester hydrolase